MKGAREFAKYFKTGRYGKLFIEVGTHARGKTFQIWVLPPGSCIEHSPWTDKNVVEVYGITGGNPGWTETYGWLHKGKWQEDFTALFLQKKQEYKAAISQEQAAKEKNAEAEKKRKQDLLAKY